MRAGDFLDGRPTGGWFDSQIAKKLHEGKVIYPGRLDAAHTWAYMPDLARAIVALVGHRDHLPAFHAIGFAGYSITGQELIDGLTAIVGNPLKLGGIPWPLLKVAGLFSPNLKCVSEMSYLWNTPHAIDGVAFDALLSEFTHTPLPQALAAVFAQLANTNS